MRLRPVGRRRTMRPGSPDLSDQGGIMDRRTFNTALAGAAATSLLGCVTGMRSDGDRTVLYQSVGPKLQAFDVDVDNATLTPRTTIELPSNVQYAWPHPSRRFLYVSTSDSAS